MIRAGGAQRQSGHLIVSGVEDTMVTGPLRVVLWVLGGAGVLWALFRLGMLFGMGGRSTTGGGTMHDGMGYGMTDGMQGWGGGMGWGIMSLQTIAMLGLVGIFIYLVVDSVRSGPKS